MNFLGICETTGLVYEGPSNSRAQKVHPAPLLTPIRFTNDAGIPELKTAYSDFPATIFQEDSFDAVTRIRRGRVFTSQFINSQPFRWHLIDHPLLSPTSPEVHLVTYQHDLLPSIAKLPSSAHHPRVILGRDPFLTFWKIVSIEGSVSNTPILTLKALLSLGELPEINPEKLPNIIRKPLVDALEKVDASINRLTPTEVIDRCRDALSILFGHACGDRGKDLMSAINTLVSLDDRGEDLQYNASRIIARLHSRAKPTEQASRGLREPSEEDAHLSVRCLWFVLVERGWAN